MNDKFQIGHIGWSPDYNSNKPRVRAVDVPRIVRRDAFICKYCDGVYADEPVTSCDCLGYLDQEPPHFIKGKIEYRLPNAEAIHGGAESRKPKDAFTPLAGASC
jgi:hypothetical protein